MSIADDVLALEQENDHLKFELNRLIKELENRKPDPNVDRLLDLLKPDIGRIENLTIDGRLKELIEAYRALRPIAKEGQA